MADELIVLHNSNALYKYPVDAEQLNENFNFLLEKIGQNAIKDFIESAGLTYSTLISNQLAAAVAQYVLSCTIFNESGTNSNYVLSGRDSFSLPYRYTDGMVVTFKTSRTNTSTPTIQLGTLAAYPIKVNGSVASPGYIATDTYISFVLTYYTSNPAESYWSPVTTNSSGSSSGGEESGVSNYATAAIRYAIATASLVYDKDNVTQLSTTLADYLTGLCYTATYSNNIYTISPIGSHAAPEGYKNGMLIGFVAPANNLSEPFVKINNLEVIPLADEMGVPIQADTIKSNQFVLARYSANKFCIVNQYIPNLKTGNGAILEGLSNDGTLGSDSSTLAVTEHAVREYVDNSLRSSVANTINDGYRENGAPAAVQAIGKHGLNLTAGTNAFIEQTPNDTANTIVSSNSSLAVNMVSGVDNVYWETQKTGFAVDDMSRIAADVTGTGSNKVIQVQTDLSGTVIYLHNPAQPEWFGVKDVTTIPTHAKIKYTDTNHTPTSFNFQINASNSASGTWYDLVTPIYDDSAAEITPLDSTGAVIEHVYDINGNEYAHLYEGKYQSMQVYDANHNVISIYDANHNVISVFSTNHQVADTRYFGDVTDIVPDADGVYTLPVPSNYAAGAGLFPTVASLVGANAFAFRVVITQFDGQYATQARIDSQNYDPNTDTDPTTTKYSVQVAYLKIGKIVDAPALSYTYPNTDTGLLENCKYFTQYYLTEYSDEPVNGVTLTQVTDGTYTAYIDNVANTLKLVNNSIIKKQSTAPTPEASNEGGIWFDTTSKYPNTYICTNVSSSETPVYEWVLTNVMLLATVTYLNNEISNVQMFAYGTDIQEEHLLAADDFDYSVTHNFGTDVNVSISLECTTIDNGYAVGDIIHIAPFMNMTYTLESGPSLAATEHYLQISSNKTVARVKAANLQIIHKNTGVISNISNNCWTIHISVSKVN